MKIEFENFVLVQTKFYNHYLNKDTLPKIKFFSFPDQPKLGQPGTNLYLKYKFKISVLNYSKSQFSKILYFLNIWKYYTKIIKVLKDSEYFQFIKISNRN